MFPYEELWDNYEIEKSDRAVNYAKLRDHLFVCLFPLWWTWGLMGIDSFYSQWTFEILQFLARRFLLLLSMFHLIEPNNQPAKSKLYWSCPCWLQLENLDLNSWTGIEDLEANNESLSLLCLCNGLLEQPAQWESHSENLKWPIVRRRFWYLPSFQMVNPSLIPKVPSTD